jgi:hypothetical protein
MADIVNSLFGIDPAALQQQRAATDTAQAFRFAQLDPLQRANMAIYQGSAGIGRGINQLLGGDEQLNRATQVRQLASQFDMTSAEGLRQFAQAVAQVAPDVAQQAIKRSDELVTAGLTQGKLIAETQAKLREKTLPTSGLGKLITERDALIAAGLPSNDPRVVAYNNAIKAEGEGKGVKVINMPPDTRGKAFEAADPEALKEYRKESRAAAGQLNLITQARENLPGAVVGQGLPAIVRGLNAQLAPLGINTDQVAKSRNLEQALKSIIAQGIKQYGANPSTVDLQFAVSAAADIKDPIQAISATLNYLETRAKSSVNKADAAEQYLLKNQNLAGFEKQWTEQVTGPKPKGKTRTLKSGIVVIEED